MRLFGVAEANALVPMLNETFTRVRALLEKQALDEVRRELSVLTELGLEVKDADGLVDFRAVRGGEVVYLCWKFPETAITHWHRLDTGYAGRRPIGLADDFEKTWAN